MPDFNFLNTNMKLTIDDSLLNSMKILKYLVNAPLLSTLKRHFITVQVVVLFLSCYLDFCFVFETK